MQNLNRTGEFFFQKEKPIYDDGIFDENDKKQPNNVG